MRLINAELKKVWKNKNFYMLMLVIVGVNALLLLGSIASDPNRVEASAYRKLAVQISSMSMQEKEELIVQNKQRIEAIAKIEYAARICAYDPSKTKQYQDLLQIELEKYGQSFVKENYLKYTNGISAERLFASTIEYEFLQIKNYKDFLSEIQEKTAYTSIFTGISQDNSFGTKNIILTGEAYEKMQHIVPSFVVQKSLHNALNFQFTDILLIASCFLLGFIIIWQEKTNGMLRIVLSCKNGRKATALAKMVCVGVSLCVLTCVMYGTNLAICAANYGQIPLLACIQSFQFLMRSVLNVNTITYIALFLVVKWLAVSCIGAVIMLGMLSAKNLVAGISYSLVAFSAMLVLRVAIPPTSDFNAIKYLNPVSLLQTNETLILYKNINFFGYPINIIYAEIIFGIVFLCLVLLVFVNCFEKMQYNYRQARLESIRKRKNIKIRPKAVWQIECKKFFLMCGACVAFFIFTGSQIYNYTTTDKTLSAQENFYQYYMVNLTGEYTPAKYNFLVNENKKFDILYELKGKLNHNTITYEEYNQAILSETVLNSKFNVFNSVVAKLENSIKQGNKYIVYDTGFKNLLETNKSAEIPLLQISLVLVFTIGFYSCIDKSGNMDSILRCTPVGRTRLVFIRQQIINSFSIMICLVEIVGDFILVLKKYGLTGIMYPAKCISNYTYLPTFISIFMVYVFSALIKIMVACCIANIIMYIGVKTQKPIYTIIFSLVIIIIPQILYAIGIKEIYYITFYPIYNIGHTLANQSYLAIPYLVVTIAGLVCTTKLVQYEYE